jgi:hypothetical protein
MIRHGMEKPSGLPRNAAMDFELRGKQIRRIHVPLPTFGGAERALQSFNDPDVFGVTGDKTRTSSASGWNRLGL